MIFCAESSTIMTTTVPTTTVTTPTAIALEVSTSPCDCHASDTNGCGGSCVFNTGCVPEGDSIPQCVANGIAFGDPYCYCASCNQYKAVCPPAASIAANTNAIPTVATSPAVTTTTSSTIMTTMTDDTALYAIAEHETNACPQGYERIFDSDDCDAANSALGTFSSGGKEAGKHVRGADQEVNSEPCGCYMFSGVYHLNKCSDGMGKATSGVWLYCKLGACRGLGVRFVRY